MVPIPNPRPGPGKGRGETAALCGAGIWFSSLLEESESDHYGAYVPGSCPNAEAVVNHVINLPTHGRVTEKDAVRLAAIVCDAVEDSGVPTSMNEAGSSATT